jgi:hypothetical protein
VPPERATVAESLTWLLCEMSSAPVPATVTEAVEAKTGTPVLSNLRVPSVI